MIKNCEICGEQFETTYKWARMCKPCFVEEKKNEMEDLRESVSYWQQQAESAKEQLKGAIYIEPTKLKKLIFLCHPDKHANSESAKEITQWLLSIRK